MKTLTLNEHGEYTLTEQFESNKKIYIKVTLNSPYNPDSWRIDFNCDSLVTENTDYKLEVFDENGNEHTGELESGKTYYIVVSCM